MNKVKLCLVLLFPIFTFLACSNSTSDDEAGSDSAATMKRYGIEKACIEYTVSGSGQEGTEILYFDNWGAREAKYELNKITIGPITQEIDNVTYLDGDMIYTYNRIDGTGTKMENPLMKMFEGQDLDDVGKKMMEQMGGEKIRSEEFLGKMCDVWELKQMGITSWVWNGVTLKTLTDMMGMKIEITAIKISESFDKEKLQRPDIEYQDIGAMIKNLTK